MMSDIISTTEDSPFDDVNSMLEVNISSEYATMAQEAYELSRSFNADAILLVSNSGFTARLISHFRPEAKILMATKSQVVLNQTSLLWGTEGYLFEKQEHLDDFMEKMEKKAVKEKKLKKGEKVIFLMGKFPTGEKMRLIGVKVI